MVNGFFFKIILHFSNSLIAIYCIEVLITFFFQINICFSQKEWIFGLGVKDILSCENLESSCWFAPRLLRAAAWQTNEHCHLTLKTVMIFVNDIKLLLTISSIFIRLCRLKDMEKSQLIIDIQRQRLT